MTIRSAVPPRAIAVMPVTARMISGRTEIKPKNNAPSKVMRPRTLEIYSEVEAPGRMPGINAPFF